MGGSLENDGVVWWDGTKRNDVATNTVALDWTGQTRHTRRRDFKKGTKDCVHAARAYSERINKSRVGGWELPSLAS